MNILDLQSATLAPKRWQRIIKSNSLSTTRVVALESIPDNIYLVPGGRFLVAQHNQHLTLWDLHGKINAVNSVLCDCDSFTTHMSPDGSKLRLLTLRDSYESIMVMEVLEIAPWEERPRFNSIAQLRMYSDFHLNFTTVCNDVIGVVHGPIIKLWNFVTNEWATWNVNHVSRQILMTDKAIILISDLHLTLWDVPKLAGNASIEALKAEPQAISSPRLVLPYPPPDIRYSCYGLCDWYTGSPQPLWFDNIEASNDAEFFDISRFDVDPDSPLVKSTFSTRLPCTRSTCIAPYRVCGENIVILWCNETGVYCHTGSPTLDHVTTLCLTDNPRIMQTTLCPISGRLVYVPRTSDRSAPPEMHVLDFIPPTDNLPEPDLSI